jgi:hypothetical protein
LHRLEVILRDFANGVRHAEAGWSSAARAAIAAK